MRKWIYVLAVCLFTLPSCLDKEDTEADYSNLLIGKWRWMYTEFTQDNTTSEPDEEERYYTIYKSDGTWEEWLWLDLCNEEYLEDSGGWRIESSPISLNSYEYYLSEWDNRHPAGWGYEYLIETLTKTDLVLSRATIKYHYKRVK